MIIAIGCPVANRAWILPEYLAALDALNWPRKRYLFVDDRSEDATPKILKRFALESCGAVVERWCGPPGPGHRRGQYGMDGYTHLAALRNRLAEMFLESGTDALFSVDSDVIVPPDALRVLAPLVADGRTIAALAISNVAGRELDGEAQGNFMVERDGVFMHLPRRAPDGRLLEASPTKGTLEVDAAGACMLIPRAAFERGVRWGAHHQGEDLFFAECAYAAGFRFVVSFDSRPEHRMEAA